MYLQPNVYFKYKKKINHKIRFEISANVKAKSVHLKGFTVGYWSSRLQLHSFALAFWDLTFMVIRDTQIKF